MKQGQTDPRTERASTWSELEEALARFAPGYRTLDRALRLDGRAIADSVGVVDGRPCLVLAAAGGAGELVPRALAALACAAAHPEALLAHLAGAESSVRSSAWLVALVADGELAPDARAALLALGRPDLWILERHRLESERGATSFLVRVVPAGEELRPAPPPRAEPASGLEALLRELAPRDAALARDLAERIGRVDPELEREAREGALVWLADGRELCRLAVREGRLEGRLAGHPLPHRLDAQAAAEVFLDLVLGAHLEGLDLGLEEGDDDLDEDDDEDDERAPLPPLGHGGALLTREEIEAFRD